MKITIEGKYYPTPEQMADEVWKHMTDEEQAEFLYFLFCRGNESYEMLQQIDYVVRELGNICSDEDLNHIRWMLKKFVDRIGEINES